MVWLQAQRFVEVFFSIGKLAQFNLKETEIHERFNVSRMQSQFLLKGLHSLLNFPLRPRGIPDKIIELSVLRVAQSERLAISLLGLAIAVELEIYFAQF